jgi:hypothetical protein
MYEPFGPLTMIAERRFLLVLSRRIGLFIEKNDEGKGAMGRRVFLPSSIVGFWESRKNLCKKQNLSLTEFITGQARL